LIEDGLWKNFQSSKRLAKVLLRIFRNLLTRFLKICRPGYHPDQIADPKWAVHWAKLYLRDPEQAAQLDTNRFDSDTPIPMTSV
jgi:hypothetical protein